MTVIEDVRRWAAGMHATTAGAELLIRQGVAVYDGAPWIKPSNDRAWIDVDLLLHESGVWSGGEQRVVRIACSMLGGPPVDLSEELPGLDRRATELVLAAVAHAAGSHEDSEVVVDDEGRPTGFRRLSSAYPWPGGEGA